jgi:formylglycine-generating enzyme required for sulfatase activity
MQEYVDSIEMIEIPGGSFAMGSPKGELGRFDCEGPQHSVTVQPFLMGKYPVTQAQWRAVAALPRVNRDLNPDPAKFKGDNRPVEQVGWNGAVEFCQRLSVHTGRKYRLPSEAEWEYACRAGTTTPFHFGETLTPELANYRGISTNDSVPKGEYRQQTTDVGSFPPNAFDLHDMHGNVGEWCLDHWHKNYQGAPTDGNAWGNEDDRPRTARTVRGGSWVDPWTSCRSAYRNANSPDYRYDVIGFRVVCVSVN